LVHSFNIYLLRHGEITSRDVLAGRTNFSLSDKGWEQMTHSLLEMKADTCISSPLKRCKVFAEEFSRKHSIPFIVENRIQEMNFGSWDGKSYEELWRLPKPNIGDFWQQPFAHTPPEGESFSKFAERITSWWLKLLNTQEQKDVLIVTHAGVIKCILAHVLSVESNQEQFTKLATSLSIGYGQLITLSVYIEQGSPAYVQVHL